MPTDKNALRDLPKKDRKAVARELARVEREHAAKVARRRRWYLRFVAVLAVLAVVAAVALIVQARQRAGRVGPANALSDGVLLGGNNGTVYAGRTDALQPGDKPVATGIAYPDGGIDIVMYFDYADKKAAEFWKAQESTIDQSVKTGYVTLEIHPLALKDNAYSLRAAGTIGCVANTKPDAVYAVHQALMAAQPTLDADGLSAAELVSLVKDAGVNDSVVTSCIKRGSFTDWAKDITERAAVSVPFTAVKKVDSSPVVLVGDKFYDGTLTNSQEFITFMTLVTNTRTAEAQAAATGQPTAPADEPTDGATDAPTDGVSGDPSAEPTVAP